MFAYNDSNDFYFFIFYVFPPVVFFFGLIGNTLALIVFQKKNLKKIGPVLMHKFLFITDSIYLLTAVTTYNAISFGISFINDSAFVCKVYFYLNHTFTPYSAQAIIYISMDRFISFKLPSRRFQLKNEKTQLVFILGFVLFNLVYEVPALFNYGIYVSNNDTKVCTSVNPTMREVILYMDLIYRIIFLSILMLIISILIIYFIFQSRSQIRRTTNNPENMHTKRDIRLAVTSVMINLVYFFLNSQFINVQPYSVSYLFV